MPIHQAEPALLCRRCSQRLCTIRTGPYLFPGLPLMLDPDFCPWLVPSFDLVSDPLMSATPRITRQQVSNRSNRCANPLGLHQTVYRGAGGDSRDFDDSRTKYLIFV